MKFVITILSCLLIATSARAAERERSLSELIKETKGYLAIYAELNPLGNSYYSLRMLPLSKKELRSLFREKRSDPHL